VPDEGVFVINDVFPGVEAGSLTATAELPDGASVADSVSLQVASADPALDLSASPASGEPPLDVALELTTRVQVPDLARIDFDTDGDGALDIVGSPVAGVSTTVDDARSFVARGFVITSSGVELTAPARIGVYESPVVLDEFAVGNPVDLVSGSEGSL
jgi:hypothetical protein